ncbi:cell division protein FtsZ [Magnetococcus marinus MC-1]|uniref:Cell division protein FtsZ n=1 Tax=Magnetococcus marinus (strain ATCC BAA-1437 / JCM 17883 / MC-1) TaxID=156889 RepID=A0L5M5_MAGMM|nr:cell division protein FtsZ [Magnetococcus marinus]ABK43268.1 cell division protein FtsZ [Magnetococcus marinus MC-1]
MTIEFAHTDDLEARIKVIGVGGGGGNAVNNMIQSHLEGVEFIVANTDAQALTKSLAPTRIQIGEDITRGLGAGAKPEVGKNAAMETEARLRQAIEGADMVFITAGMGGGTGTGAAPIIARISKELGILTVAVVTKPFHFEGKRRMRQAEEGLEELRDHVDTVITIPNQKLMAAVGKNTTILDAFRKADDVLQQAVRGITDLITHPGHINVDFADVCTVMEEMGQAMMGAAEASGEGRAMTAINNAISSPLLDDASIHGARGVLVNITGGYNLTLQEVDEAVMVVRDMAHEDANIVFGTTLNENLDDTVRVTVVATGIGQSDKMAFPAQETTFTETVAPQPHAPAARQAPSARQAAPAYHQQAAHSTQHPAYQQQPSQPQTAVDYAAQAKVVDNSYVRQMRQERQERQRRNVDGVHGGHEDFDVPTFLRRQMD